MVIGVSPDSAASHDKFKAKHGLAVALAADPERSAIEAYGVWKEKSMYGRKYFGVERSTFLIGRDGRIAKVWRKVKVPQARRRGAGGRQGALTVENRMGSPEAARFAVQERIEASSKGSARPRRKKKGPPESGPQILQRQRLSRGDPCHAIAIGDRRAR